MGVLKKEDEEELDVMKERRGVAGRDGGWRLC